jgi:hypothetical protein
MNCTAGSLYFLATTAGQGQKKREQHLEQEEGDQTNLGFSDPDATLLRCLTRPLGREKAEKQRQQGTATAASTQATPALAHRMGEEVGGKRNDNAIDPAGNRQIRGADTFYCTGAETSADHRR